MHTEIYCQNLEQLERVKAIRAIHQAYLMLSALAEHTDTEHYDLTPSLDALRACLVDAGHPIGATYSTAREHASAKQYALANGLDVRHDMYGFYVLSTAEAEHEDAGNPSVGFDMRRHFADIKDAWQHAERAALDI